MLFFKTWIWVVFSIVFLKKIESHNFPIFSHSWSLKCPTLFRMAPLLHDILLERRDEVLRGRNNDISTSPQRLRQVSNETPNNISVVRHQDVSVVRVLDVPLVRLYDVSCRSQMKHSITSLWYVSTTSQSYVVATPC